MNSRAGIIFWAVIFWAEWLDVCQFPLPNINPQRFLDLITCPHILPEFASHGEMSHVFDFLLKLVVSSGLAFAIAIAKDSTQGASDFFFFFS